MKKEPHNVTRCVHQFHSGTGSRDAITKQMFAIQSLLHKIGYNSEIFAEHIEPQLRDKIKPLSLYEGSSDQVLLWHHSMGSYGFDKMMEVPDRVVTVYHNITPSKYLSEEGVREFAELGLVQLEMLAQRSSWGVADSNFNRREMHRFGFNRVEVVPPKLTFSSPANHANRLRKKDWIFVGRIVPNKCQHDLVLAFAKYLEFFDSSARLFLVGDTVDRDYYNVLVAKINSLGLSSNIEITGSISDASRDDLYAQSSVFVSMSEHEGFGVPLIEAFEHSALVFAYEAAAVPETLGGAGVLFRSKDPYKVASLVNGVLSDQLLSESILDGQRRRLLRLSTFDASRALQKVIGGAFGVDQPISVQVKGPIESSYSLAITNRQLAEQLSRQSTYDVSLYATEGPGDYEPDPVVLSRYPKARELLERGKVEIYPEIEVRQMWPPRLFDASGSPTIEYFAWEESLVPAQIVIDFNRYCDAVAVTSEFVKEALIDSGVLKPIYVVGNGVVRPTREGLSMEIPELEECGRVSFLSVSSALPRKGLDVLLKAYFEAFDGFDDVTLVLKMPSDQPAEINNLLATLRSSTNTPPDVRIVSRDLTDSELHSLYYRVSCFVNSSRGEGFGLPVAEAMLAGLPVISVAHSGLSDFVSAETAAVVPSTPVPSQSHVRTNGSLWFEPDGEQLVTLMQRFYYEGNDDDSWRERSVKAEELIATKYSWESVSKRWNEVFTNTGSSLRRLRVAMLTTWNSKCGIAEYSSYLRAHLDDNAHIDIIAETGVETLDPIRELGVQRLWQNRWHGDLVASYEAITELNPDLVHVQFNFAFFELGGLAQMVEKLQRSRPVIVTLHSTIGRVIDDKLVDLSTISETLANVDALIVHSQADVERLAKIGISGNVELIRHGVADCVALERSKLIETLAMQGKLIVGTFGFLLPHKGILELLDAFRCIRDKEKEAHLIALSALHPDVMSREFETVVRERIKELNLESDVTLITEFLPDDVTVNILSACTIVVLPYQETNESSSGSAHLAISALRPLIVSDVGIFDPLSEYVFRYDSESPEGLLDAMLQVLYDDDLMRSLENKVASASRRLSWERIASQHLELYHKVVYRGRKA